jgi:hypothetical protein
MPDPDRPIPARPSLPFSSDPLFDQATAEVGIDDSPLRALDRFEQTRIRDSLAPGKPPKPLRLVGLQGLPINTMNYSTENDTK